MVDSERLRKAIEEFWRLCDGDYEVSDGLYPVNHDEMRKITGKLAQVLRIFVDELCKEE